MLNINRVDIRIQNYNNRQHSTAVRKPHLEYKCDKTFFCGNKTKNSDDDSKIGFIEGAGLFLGGACGRIKDMALFPLKHPVMAVTAGIITTGAMCTLPLMGISSVAGAAILGTGYAIFSAFNMIKNVKNAVQSFKENDNVKLRKDLKEIGASCVDAVISAKTFKNNIGNIKNQLKYGKIGFRKDFAEDFKNQKGLSKKISSLNESNKKINSQINKFAGIDGLQKELKFSDDVKQEYLKLYDIKDDKEFINKAYNRLTLDLGYNKGGKNSPILIFDTSKDKNYIAAYDKYSNSVCVNLEQLEKCDRSRFVSILRHELQHFQQMIDIERTKGLGIEKLEMLGKKKNNEWALEELEKNCDFGAMAPEDIEVYKNAFKKTLKHPEAIFVKNPKKEFIDGSWYSNFNDSSPILLDSKDRYNLFNNIRKLANEQGEIKPYTKASRKARKLFNSALNYTEAPYRKDCKNYFEYMQKYLKYIFNYKEVNARHHETIAAPFAEDISTSSAIGALNIFNIQSLNK